LAIPKIRRFPLDKDALEMMWEPDLHILSKGEKADSRIH
jgi:hypothetical protein